MATELTTLPALAAQIDAAHQTAIRHAKSAIEAAIECGRLLIAAKAQVAHGEWLPWIEANLAFGPRQAQKYIRLAQHGTALPNATSNSHLTIDRALEALTEPRGDDLTAEYWLAEMNREWREMSPAAKEAFLLIVDLVGTEQNIPDFLAAADLKTLRMLHATAKAALALKLYRKKDTS